MTGLDGTAADVAGCVVAYANLTGYDNPDPRVLDSDQAYRATWRTSPEGWSAQLWIDLSQRSGVLVTAAHVLANSHGVAVAVQVSLEPAGDRYDAFGFESRLFKASLPRHISQRVTEPHLDPEAAHWIGAPVLHAALLDPYQWLDPTLTSTPVEALHVSDVQYVVQNAARGLPSNAATKEWPVIVGSEASAEAWMADGWTLDDLRPWTEHLPLRDPNLGCALRKGNWTLGQAACVLRTNKGLLFNSTDGRVSQYRAAFLDKWITACGTAQRAALLAAAGLTLTEAAERARTMTEADEAAYATLAALQAAFEPNARLLSLT